MSSGISSSPTFVDRPAASSRSPAERQPLRRRIAYWFISSLVSFCRCDATLGLDGRVGKGASSVIWQLGSDGRARRVLGFGQQGLAERHVGDREAPVPEEDRLLRVLAAALGAGDDLA